MALHRLCTAECLSSSFEERKKRETAVRTTLISIGSRVGRGKRELAELLSAEYLERAHRYAPTDGSWVETESAFWERVAGLHGRTLTTGHFDGWRRTLPELPRVCRGPPGSPGPGYAASSCRHRRSGRLVVGVAQPLRSTCLHRPSYPPAQPCPRHSSRADLSCNDNLGRSPLPLCPLGLAPPTIA